MDDLNPYESRHGTIWYVNCMFTDDSVGSVGKKTEESALTVQRQLQDAIGEELDFQVEDDGTSGAGRQKWKIIGFGVPGEEPAYTAPSVQGGGSGVGGPVSSPRRSRPPEPSNEQASIRAAVAVKAAVELGGDINTVLENADVINAWMLEKTSEPALSAYGTAVEDDNPVRAHQTGASSEDSSAGGPLGPPLQPPADSEGGVATKGKEPAPPSHEHDWYSRQGVPKFLVCDCGATRKRETV
jgi:hypothetical protein